MVTVVTLITLKVVCANICIDTIVTLSHMVDQILLPLALVVALLTLEFKFSFSLVNRPLVLVQEVFLLCRVVAEVTFVVPDQSCRRSKINRYYCTS